METYVYASMVKVQVWKKRKRPTKFIEWGVGVRFLCASVTLYFFGRRVVAMRSMGGRRWRLEDLQGCGRLLLADLCMSEDRLTIELTLSEEYKVLIGDREYNLPKVED